MIEYVNSYQNLMFVLGAERHIKNSNLQISVKSTCLIPMIGNGSVHPVILNRMVELKNGVYLTLKTTPKPSVCCADPRRLISTRRDFLIGIVMGKDSNVRNVMIVLGIASDGKFINKLADINRVFTYNYGGVLSPGSPQGGNG